MKPGTLQALVWILGGSDLWSPCPVASRQDPAPVEHSIRTESQNLLSLYHFRISGQIEPPWLCSTTQPAEF